MTTLFLVCAVFGGTILVCQTILTLIGISGDHDSGLHGDVVGVDHDFSAEVGSADDAAQAGHDSTWFFSVVTFRTVIAAITFFGLGGMSAATSRLPESQSLAIALGSGLAAMYGVHWLMRQLSRFHAEGNVRIERAVGMTGSVYLRVPPARQGAGKILLALQNRTVELVAWTDQAELPTGATVVVTRVLGPDSVEVVAASA